MALDRLEAIEKRVQKLVELVQSLKRANAKLEEDLRQARERLHQQDESNRRWAQERVDIRSRIERVLEDVEALECLGDATEVTLEQNR